MNRYEGRVEKVIRESDLLLIIVDARHPYKSLNKKLLNRVVRQHKKFLYVVNKIDLVTKEEQDMIRLPDAIFISAKKHIGTMRLLRKIREHAKGEDITVGVVGFPNTGKSSVINALKGKESAKSSSVSGLTRHLQKVRITKNVLMIDTPGVYSYHHMDNVRIGAVDPDKIKEPEYAAAELIDELDGKVEAHFKVDRNEDALDTLEEIAVKMNIYKKGKVPDVRRMGVQVLRLWQKGKIR